MSDAPGDLTALLSAIRSQAVALARKAWPELGALADAILPDPQDPFALLPVASGAACGARPDEVTPVAAAVVLSALALRVLDDCADRDNPHALDLSLGAGRAVNAAAAMSAAAGGALSRMPLPAEQREALADAYFRALLKVHQGQDRDLQTSERTLSDYRQTVEAKTVAAYEFAALAGALASTVEPARVARASACGAHIGWMIQILDDIEALWFPDGAGDWARGRLTFPVLMGVALDHPAAAELRRMRPGDGGDEGRVRALLDAMGVRPQLMTLALNHRDAALEALGPPLDPCGRTLLETWLDWLLRDGARLAGIAG